MKLQKALALTAVLGVTAGWVGQANAVGTRYFVLDSGKDFEGGELSGVAVDSSGKLRAGLSLGSTSLSDASSVWASLTRSDGSVLVATGNEGKLLRVQGNKADVVAQTKALALTSLAEGWDGRVFAGSMPDGKLYELKGDKLVEWVSLDGAQHVWALAYDPASQALFAATGPQGKLFRITKDGQAQVYFDAAQEHLMSVAVGGGKVYAGASDAAVLYTVSGPGRASVLYDFGRTEVRAIAVDARGVVYAIANQLEGGGRGGKLPSTTQPPGPKSGSPLKGKGTLYRFTPDGAPEQLLDDTKEHFVSLALGDNGQPYVGTGSEGRVLTVDDDQNSLLLADTEERQIAALSVRGSSGYVVASDPAVFRPIRGLGGANAVWTSKVLDAGHRATFGRMTWDATGTLELSTRSGNTTEPDDTWSDWSAPLQGPGPVTSPPGRFLQVRARWSRDQKAELGSLQVPFVTDNLRAVVTEVSAASSAEVKGSTGVKKSGGPVGDKPDTKIKLSWKVQNPDEDELRYRLQYRLIGSKEWFDVLEPTTVHTSESYSWDTSDLPEGRYRVRVEASDELSNPPDRVKRHQRESQIVLVDNTPPTVEQLRVDGRRIRGIALDGVGPIQRIDVSMAGSNQWVPFFPVDGVFDEQREEFDVDVSVLLPQGPGMVTLRVYDSANNAVLRHVKLQ
jgi:sugar lactone lactonase YvrE